MRVLESILIGLTLLRTVRALSQSVNKDSGNAFLPSCRADLDLAAGRGPVRSAAASGRQHVRFMVHALANRLCPSRGPTSEPAWRSDFGPHEAAAAREGDARVSRGAPKPDGAGLLLVMGPSPP
jgi:hypothetical protein